MLNTCSYTWNNVQKCCINCVHSPIVLLKLICTQNFKNFYNQNIQFLFTFRPKFGSNFFEWTASEWLTLFSFITALEKVKLTHKNISHVNNTADLWTAVKMLLKWGRNSLCVFCDVRTCGHADMHTFSFLLETIIYKTFMNLKPSYNNTANTFCVHLMVYLVGSMGVIETSLILFKGKSWNVQTVQQILTHTENC